MVTPKVKAFSLPLLSSSCFLNPAFIFNDEQPFLLNFNFCISLVEVFFEICLERKSPSMSFVELSGLHLLDRPRPSLWLVEITNLVTLL